MRENILNFFLRGWGIELQFVSFFDSSCYTHAAFLVCSKSFFFKKSGWGGGIKKVMDAAYDKNLILL